MGTCKQFAFLYRTILLEEALKDLSLVTYFRDESELKMFERAISGYCFTAGKLSKKGNFSKVYQKNPFFPLHFPFLIFFLNFFFFL